MLCFNTFIGHFAATKNFPLPYHQLKLWAYLLILCALAGNCSAQLPDYYKTVNRVTWVVENLDRVRPAWEALGLTYIQRYVNISLAGQFRGEPITIHAWQITGQLGNLTVDMIQSGEGQANAYNNFHSKLGDGILAIVYEVPNRQALDLEIQRMKSKGVGVWQQVTMTHGKGAATTTYFDTMREGKYTLGLVLNPAAKPAPSRSMKVSHFSPVVYQGDAVSAYWSKLGFPAFAMQPADGMETGYQRHSQFPLEWIAPPPGPSNLFTDFLNKRQREGIHHIGIEVDHLAKAVAAYQKLGYRVRHSSAGKSVFMATESAGGVAVELIQKN